VRLLYVDLSTFNSVGDITNSLPLSAKRVLINKKNAITERLMEDERAKLKEERQALADSGADTIELDAVEDYSNVFVAGDTWQWKDEIKEIGALYKQSGRGYRWDGENKRWVVSMLAFNKLLERYPAAKNDLFFELAA